MSKKVLLNLAKEYIVKHLLYRRKNQIIEKVTISPKHQVVIPQ